MLADPDEPFVLADGTKINPATGTVIKEKRSRGGFVEIPNAQEAVALVAKTRRAIAEVPVPPQQMNTISLVLFYSMWGLNDQDIAAMFDGKLSVPQIRNIKQLPEYQTISNDILKSVLEFESNDIRTYLNQNARRAAEKVVELIEEEGALGFAASKDVLDRAGHRPADVVEHKHKMEGGLRIEYVQKTAREDIPAIDGDFINITPKDN